MSRVREAADWLGKGLSPAQIAGQMGVSIRSVMGCLHAQVPIFTSISALLWRMPTRSPKQVNPLSNVGEHFPDTLFECFSRVSADWTVVLLHSLRLQVSHEFLDRAQ